jgi:hypothetical protein
MTCPTPTGYVSSPCANHSPFPQQLHTLAATGSTFPWEWFIIAALVFLVGVIVLAVVRTKRTDK